MLKGDTFFFGEKNAILPTRLLKKKIIFFYQWDLAERRTKLHEGIMACADLKKKKKKKKKKTRVRLVRFLF